MLFKTGDIVKDYLYGVPFIGKITRTRKAKNYWGKTCQTCKISVSQWAIGREHFDKTITRRQNQIKLITPKKETIMGKKNFKSKTGKKMTCEITRTK